MTIRMVLLHVQKPLVPYIGFLFKVSPLRKQGDCVIAGRFLLSQE